MVDKHCVQYEFYNLDPFEPYRALAPDHFSHPPSDFKSMDTARDRSPIDNSRIDTEIQYNPLIVNASPQPDDANMSTSLPTSSETYVFTLLFFHSISCSAVLKDIYLLKRSVLDCRLVNDLSEPATDLLSITDFDFTLR
jgi:hypothetical protein